MKLMINLFFLASIFSFANPMVLEYDTRLEDDKKVYVPLEGIVDVTVDWGDGTDTIVNSRGVINHTYSKDTVYTVSISGTLTHFGVEECLTSKFTPLKNLVKVKDFGDMWLSSLQCAFYKAVNLEGVPSYLPPTVSNLSRTFGQIKKPSLVGLNLWDVDSVLNMSYMFAAANNFNQDLGDWNVGSVKYMNHMFGWASSFNQNINSWNVSSVINMEAMFRSATTFNQPINSWDVSAVTNMKEMFKEAEVFNQALDGWDVGELTTLERTFEKAYKFNQNIDSWDIGNVTTATYSFSSAKDFNQPLNSWNVAKIVDMSYAFHRAEKFNQQLEQWDVSSVTNMRSMFDRAYSFDQNISNWDVTQVGTMRDLLSYGKLSSSHCDSLLIAWSQLPLKSVMNLDLGMSQYHSGSASEARDSIISKFNWYITDGGMLSSNPGLTLSMADSLIIREDSVLTLTLDMTDGANTNGSLSIEVPRMKGENYTITGDELTPTRDFFGELKVAITVKDSLGLAESVNMIITVTPVNDAPVLAPDFYYLQERVMNKGDSMVALLYADIWDVDDPYENLSSIVGKGENYSVQGITVIPDHNFVGELFVPIRGTDGKDTSDIKIMTITVLDVISPVQMSEEAKSVFDAQGKATIYNIHGQILWEGTLPANIEQLKQVLQNNLGMSLLKTPQGVFKFSKFE
ncbi:BspA family leucine-rich repeat surface protein [bacterium]|nr:BspA family leucine-rich repeat surface protein [bacterium]